MPRLVMETSDGEQSVPLEGPPCVAGRLASCGLTLQEVQASRKQFEVSLVGSRWQVRDLGSRNGTFLNDERLEAEAVPLRQDDRIRVGETVVRYDAQAPVLPAGLELGNVVLGAPRGRSAYGVLYDGRQPSLDRDVTVEVLDPDRAADTQARERYQQRARSAGAFEHSAVVAVFDVAATEKAVYTVFEAFPRLRLSEQLAAGGLPRPQGLTALRLIAEALHHVHKRERVHGCLTPRSVFLHEDGEGRAKLAGLGEPPGSRLQPFRQDPDYFAAYASPEEAGGEAPQAAADIHALGLVACQVLGGRWPPAGRKAELLEQLAGELPLDLDALGLDPTVAAALAPLLAKTPSERPDAREAAAVFLELGGGGALSASSAIRRTKGRPQVGSASPKPPSAAVAKGSARLARDRKSSASSGRVAKAASSSAAKKGSARARRQGSSARAPEAEASRGTSGQLPKRTSGAQPMPRRVSDRMLEPEPPWALPARLALLTLGYALMFACAFLVSRIVLSLMG